MGATHTFKAGSLFIQTDKPYYQSGDTVTGHVYANMTSLFPGETIYLKVKGFEKCYWSEKKTRWEDKRNADGTTTRVSVEYYEHHEAKNSFYSHKFALHSWGNGGIGIGQYSLPFSFPLQANLPGTFHEEGKIGSQHDHNKEHYKATIMYKIKAETFYSGWDKMKCTQELVVREPLKTTASQQQGEMKKNTKTWCCVDNGESQIKCYFENNAYLPGEKANVVTEIDNSKCNLAIKAIKGELIKKIRLESKTSHQTITKTLNSANFGSLGPNATKNGENAIRTPVDLISFNKPIQPSTGGNLVSCQYYLKITSDMDGVTCCATDPHVTVPIQILAPPPPNYGNVQPPPNWNPTVFEVNTFSFTSSNMYSKGDVSVSLNIGAGMNQPPQMNNQVNMQVNTSGGFNQPPQQQGQVNMQVNTSGGFNQPPQQQAGVNMQVNTSGGFNQPPQQQAGVNMQVNTSGGFNQPPQQQQANVSMNVGGGFNDPHHQQGGINMNMQVSDNTNNGFNQPPGGNAQMNITMNTDTSMTGFNQ